VVYYEQREDDQFKSTHPYSLVERGEERRISEKYYFHTNGGKEKSAYWGNEKLRTSPLQVARDTHVANGLGSSKKNPTRTRGNMEIVLSSSPFAGKRRGKGHNQRGNEV